MTLVLGSVILSSYKFEGRCTYDVRTEGGGELSQRKMKEVAIILYCRSVPNADKGGRGSKNPKLFGRHMWTKG